MTKAPPQFMQKGKAPAAAPKGKAPAKKGKAPAAPMGMPMPPFMKGK